jgi:hypothetical protein
MEHTGIREEGVTQVLSTASVGERCASCQAQMASDQRYCVNCGERRGKARFPYTPPPTTAPPAVASELARPQPPRRRSAASGAVTLLGGVATLLLAMGIGVLIGHDGNPAQRVVAAQPQIITINGGAAAPSASDAATPAGGGAAQAAKAKKVTAAPKVKLTKVVVQQATQAASKVLGAAAPSNPTVAEGGSCSGGAGCENGHFSGNFFGSP